MAHNNWISAIAEIKIGNNILFGPGCTLSSGVHLFYNNNFSEKIKSEGCEIIIEDGCWIAANTNIGAGSHIQAGSLVASGCSTKGTYPSHSLIANKIATAKKTIHEQ